MLSVRAIGDLTALQTLEPVWNGLLSRSGSNSLFLTWEWISTWLEVYGDEFELLVLVAEEGEICGIAPLMIRRGKAGLSHLSRTLMFIGQEVDVAPDYLDFIVPRGLESWVVPRFVHALTHKLGDRWDFIDLATHLQTSPNREPLLRSLRDEAGIELEVVAEDVAPHAELPESWEAFLRGKSNGFRKQHKNKVNRLRRAGEVRYLRGGEDLPVDVALSHIIRLNRDRWQDAGASFRSDRYRRFHRLLCERIAPLGWVVLMLMELDGEIVAGRYDFVYQGKLWCYQGGWSPAHRELNLGDNMIAAVIEWGIGAGLREYDFLGGTAVYKDRWATASRRMDELRAANRTGRARLLGLLRQGRDLLRTDLAARARDELRAARRRLLGDNPPASPPLPPS